MTIPDGEAEARVRREKPARAGPIRSGSFPSGRQPAGAGETPQDPSVAESVAQSVRMGYDVIAENIKQGREAAAKFRQGEYNIRDVPHDAEMIISRFIHLARELSTTTFEVLEKVLGEIATLQPPNGGADMPPFRAAGVAKAAQATETAESGRMKLLVEFAGDAKAVSRTATLDRPRTPAAPNDLFATPLASPEVARPSISDVKFEMRVGVDGVIATVTVSGPLPAGVYSGLVYVRGDEVPLGVLSVEIAG